MRSIFAAAFLVFVSPSVQAADIDNAFKNSKVGDWVEYKTSGPGIEGKTKMTVVAKDDKELTYEVTTMVVVMGKEQTAPVQKLKVDLTKSYDPLAVDNKEFDVKVEKQGEGVEKIKVGDKEYDTKWAKTKSTMTIQNMKIVTEHKMWFCKDVPLSGMVRLEATYETNTSKMELIGSGKK